MLGEPSSDEEVGDRIYIGHRGSINIVAKYVGKQSHVAYAQNCENSLTQICRYITLMKNYKWRHEDLRYPITNLEPTLLFTGNYADWAQTLIYLCEMTFTIALTVGSVKGAQSLTSKALGL